MILTRSRSEVGPRLRSKTGRKLTTAAISRAIQVVIVFSIIAASSFYAVYASGRNPNQSASTVSAYQIIPPLAYQHWQSIGVRNVSSIMAGYSQYYEAVWWYFNGSAALSAINGKHDCNIPTGAGNCSGNVRTIWEDFANYTVTLHYSICGANFTLGGGNWFYGRSVMWYTSLSGNETIRVPLEIDFRYENGQWQLLRDWFGLPGEPATVMAGSVDHACPGDQGLA